MDEHRQNSRLTPVKNFLGRLWPHPLVVAKNRSSSPPWVQPLVW